MWNKHVTYTWDSCVYVKKWKYESLMSVTCGLQKQDCAAFFNFSLNLKFLSELQLNLCQLLSLGMKLTASQCCCCPLVDPSSSNRVSWVMRPCGLFHIPVLFLRWQTQMESFS